MESDLRKAGIKAGIKFAIGLFTLTAIVGIRIVTATPDGVEAEIEELEQLEVELGEQQTQRANAAREADVGVPTTQPESDSVLSGISNRVRNQFGGSDSGGPDAERLVSCRLDGGMQFMRAADCRSRGGSLKDVKPRQ